MTDVTVDLKDLKRLVEICFKLDVDERALTSVIVTGKDQNPAGAIKFVKELEAATPYAKKVNTMRYRELRDALATDTGVREALAKFVKYARVK